MGGGTFDVSAIELSEGVIEVRASHGDPLLGGDDFDARLADKLAALVESRHDNTFLGESLSTGISPNPSGGLREVLVSFDYDVDGIVYVQARDHLMKRQAGIQVTGPRGRLSEGEKAAAQAMVERTMEGAPAGPEAALRGRAEAILTNLRKAGKSKEAEEVARLLASLDAASNAEGTALDQLIDWLYEHEEA